MAVLTLADAKQHLNITVATYDAELTAIIASAEAVIAQRVGPLEPTTITARLSGQSELLLPVVPAISLTSVTPVGGTVLPASDFQLDTTAGVVRGGLGGYFGYTAYDVVYQAGRPAGALPADILMAVKELVRHLWESQRGAARSAISPMGDAANVGGPGYLLPYRVQELLAPHMQFGLA